MKKNYTLLFILVAFFANAQPPVGYYASATGTGYALKTQVYNIIAPHTELSYTPGLWNLYYTSDVRSNGKVWDIYSNCSFVFGTAAATGGNQDDGTGGNSECEKYNREHSFPKSWFANASPMYTDAFHVMPTDKKVNGARGNLAYGKVGTATYTSANGSKVGNCVAPGYPYALQVFEPVDEYKGDVARNYFYMATCYQNVISGWQSIQANGDTVLDGSSNKVFEQWYLDLMYAWHIADPVSPKEIARNNAIYAVQNNRNPFIDNPQWVLAIWGSVLTNSTFYKLEQAEIYPNPTSDNKVSINSDVILDEIDLISINGQLIQFIKKPSAVDKTYRIENLPKGFYFLKLYAENQSIVKKIMVN